LNALDFLWHGTHFPNSLFFRFAFLYVFLVLTLSYHALTHLDGVSGRAVFGTLALLIGFVFFIEVMPAEKTTEWTVYGSFAFLLANAFALALLRRSHPDTTESQVIGGASVGDMGGVSGTSGISENHRSRRMAAAEIALAALICAEITVNAGYGIGEAGIFTRDNYITRIDEVKPAVAFAESLEKSAPHGFERIEFTTHTTYNSPVIYDYKGISYYSSTSYVAVNDLFGKLGLIHSNAWYVYRSAPPPLNSMFAIKYLLSREGAFDNGIYPEVKDRDVSAVGVTSASDSAVSTSAEGVAGTDIRVYENPYFLPLGFIADESVEDWNLSQSNPFLLQEDFIRRASGFDEPIFQRLEPRGARLDNMTVTTSGATGANAMSADGIYRYQPSGEDRDLRAVYTATAPRDGPVYFYVKSPKIKEVKVTNGAMTKAHNIQYPYIIDAEYVRAGEDVEIELEFDGREADSFTLYAYAFDEAAYQQAYARLSRQGLNVTRYTDTRLEGEIDVLEPGLLYTSIPFDEGWQVRLDGEPVQKESLGGGALLALRIGTRGLHTIELRYRTPGLIPGALVTLLALTALVLFIGLARRRRVRKPYHILTLRRNV
jgi:uncharacterized membrane protein YfhO